MIPGRHSLFWKLALWLCLSAVFTVVLSGWLVRTVGEHVVLLDQPAKTVMREYARQAEDAWRQGGADGVSTWLQRLNRREPGDAMVVDGSDHSLSGRPLTDRQRAGLRFQRQLDWRMSFRSTSMPYIGVPFPDDPRAGRLVMQLPPRFMPGRHWPLWQTLLVVVLPALLAMIAGGLLYWRTMVPLRLLQARVRRFQDDPEARVGAGLARRRDEFGDLGRRFDRMAERVAQVLGSQRQLLHDMSHELRTPLSRLSVALGGDLSEQDLRRRVAREVIAMRELVSDTLSLAWHDTEQRHTVTEPLSPAAVWDLVVDNAAFESGWPTRRFPCRLPADARVLGNLNDLAQALENLVRNAVRHSPENGLVCLDGHRQGQWWHLWISDQGPGVPDDRLDTIFEPFVRLDQARSAGSGFGLGLSIARRAVSRQGGRIWADNGRPGLRVHLRLPAAPEVPAANV